jgi:hypothetical protein
MFMLLLHDYFTQILVIPDFLLQFIRYQNPLFFLLSEVELEELVQNESSIFILLSCVRKDMKKNEVKN